MPQDKPKGRPKKDPKDLKTVTLFKRVTQAEADLINQRWGDPEGRWTGIEGLIHAAIGDGGDPK